MTMWTKGLVRSVKFASFRSQKQLNKQLEAAKAEKENLLNTIQENLKVQGDTLVVADVARIRKAVHRAKKLPEVEQQITYFENKLKARHEAKENQKAKDDAKKAIKESKE